MAPGISILSEVKNINKKFEKYALKRAIVVIPLLLTVLSSLSALGRSDEILPFEERYQTMDWEDIVAEADGQTLYFYMWGGNESYNRWVSSWFAGRLMEKYNVHLQMVPVDGPGVYINKVLAEKQAGRNSGGSVDLMWINGENFRAMKKADLLFGPFADRLPNISYMDESKLEFDFGYPIEGYESPYGAAQSVFEYNSARVPDPPSDMGALLEWAKENPGRLTYPAPPDFTGSLFVRHVFYYVAGGYEDFMGPFDEEIYSRIAPKVWELLNEVEPYLWSEGKTYPSNLSRTQDLLANGEIWFSINYSPDGAADYISKGRFPESIRTYMFDTGMIGNLNFLAISFNSNAKAAAMVAANEVLSPEVQYHAASPEGMFWMSPLDMERLPETYRRKFESLPLAPSRLPAETLNRFSLPEPGADWLTRIERDWQAEVLRK